MKKFFLAAILASSALISANVSAQTAKGGALETVPSVDLKRSAGKWFEIARYPNKFQKQCVGNTTAMYNFLPDGNIEVVNQCVKKDGTTINAKGKGRFADKSNTAKLEVRFAPGILSFLPNVWGDYWIIDLDDQYNYAAVGDPKREYFWILSRQPEISDAVYQNILRRAEAKGFNPGKVIKTPQKLEIIKGSVIEKQ